MGNLDSLRERAEATARVAFTDERQANFVSGLMMGSHWKETEALRAELEQVSRDRYKAATELTTLRDDNEQLRASVEFELDSLRRVVKGIEGTL